FHLYHSITTATHFFFVTPPATTQTYSLSLHDALPIYLLIREAYDASASDIHLEATRAGLLVRFRIDGVLTDVPSPPRGLQGAVRSEEHTSELQSLRHLVCRLLLEKKKRKQNRTPSDA